MSLTPLFATWASIVLGLCGLAFQPVLAAEGPAPAHFTPCEGGLASGFPCSRVDLQERITPANLGGGNGNDIWGWTDPLTGREYALMGLTNGTAFVDITEPGNAVRLGNLPTHSGNSAWRDIKTYGNYAYIVSEAVDHGLQVFDLTRLRNVVGAPVTFTEDGFYGQFGRAHNIVIDEASGFAYAVGSRQGLQICGSGLHMIDIRTPLAPSFAGCFSADGYTHDAQCLVYQGADVEHRGKQICFAHNEDTVTIVDVTTKSAPIMLSRTGYPGSSYTHQGWLTDDQRYLLVNDELDEIDAGHPTRTYVFDLLDLDQPQLHMTYQGTTLSSDHNLYVKGGFAYEANYRSGLRILDISGIGERAITEFAYFDTQPSSNASGTSGAWSVYPFFDSGNVIVSDISAGLFVLRPNLCPAAAAPQGLVAAAGASNQINLSWTPQAAGSTVEVLRSLDGCAGVQNEIASGILGSSFSDGGVSGGVPYGYRIRARGADPACVSPASECVLAQASGECTAPPVFAGLSDAGSPGSSQCAINLQWPAATPRCSGPASYRVERSTGVSFDAATATRLVDLLPGTQYADTSVQPRQAYAYRVRAIDSGNGSLDDNQSVLIAQALGPIADGSFITGAELGDPLLGQPTRHVAWETVSNVARSGERSYYSTYEDSQCLSLVSPPLMITPGQVSTLSFHTRYAMEAGWDGGVVQISSNDGASWQTISPTGGYPASFNASSNDACGLPNSSGAFTGSALAWTPYSFDLGAYNGSVRFRFLFSTDGNTTDQGWWIDDLVLTHVQVPGSCEPSELDLFADGFEQAP